VHLSIVSLFFTAPTLNRVGTISALSQWIQWFKVIWQTCVFSETRNRPFDFLPCEHSYASAFLGMVILSVCLSHAWIVTKLNDALGIFWYHTKEQSLCYSWHEQRSVGGRCPLPLKSVVRLIHALWKTLDFDRFTLIMSQP